MKKPQIGIIMGSLSDLEVMQHAADMLKSFAIPYEITVVSAHRTPQRMFTYAQSAEKRGLKVIIAGAGGSAHLPGMVASLTNLPVIGVPIHTKTLAGIDSLYSIVQMPPGIPVATVAINGSKNAAILAVKIIAISDTATRQKLNNFTTIMLQDVEQQIKEVEAKNS
jgi:5-(carboxyamino)imidazole ribonucleotide mutase